LVKRTETYLFLYSYLNIIQTIFYTFFCAWIYTYDQ